ncbi:hypothetical protein D9M68_741650 [compost metagenome]
MIGSIGSRGCIVRPRRNFFFRFAPLLRRRSRPTGIRLGGRQGSRRVFIASVSRLFWRLCCEVDLNRCGKLSNLGGIHSRNPLHQRGQTGNSDVPMTREAFELGSQSRINDLDARLVVGNCTSSTLNNVCSSRRCIDPVRLLIVGDKQHLGKIILLLLCPLDDLVPDDQITEFIFRFVFITKSWWDSMSHPCRPLFARPLAQRDHI